MRPRRVAVTGLTFAALMLGLLPAATLASSSSMRDVGPRPDAQMRYIGASSVFGRYVVNGRWVGQHITNGTAAHQTLRRHFVGAAPRGTKYLFEIKITNHGAPGAFSVAALGTSSWSENYRAERTDSTSAVVDGTFRTPILARGQSYLVRIIAKLGRPGTSFTKRLVVTSDEYASAGDVVRLDLRYGECGC